VIRFVAIALVSWSLATMGYAATIFLAKPPLTAPRALTTADISAAFPGIFSTAAISPAYEKSPRSIAEVQSPATRPSPTNSVTIVPGPNGCEVWTNGSTAVVIKNGNVLGWAAGDKSRPADSGNPSAASASPASPSASGEATDKHYFVDGSSTEVDTFSQNGQSWTVQIDRAAPAPVQITRVLVGGPRILLRGRYLVHVYIIY
jgi:hypothetical protein